MTINLTAHHLQFTVQATTPITFHDFKGSALRGSFATYLRNSFCPESRTQGRSAPDPLHQAVCPVCHLLALDQGGDVRRPYAIEPPLTEQNHFAPGETFTFGMTLYGEKLAFLPYLVLSVKGMGDTQGVGQRNESGRRGRFTIQQIEAVNPFSGERQMVLAPGAQMVHMPALPVTGEQVLEAAERLAAEVVASGNRLRVHFLTPTRIIRQKRTLKTPEFFPFCKQVVLRVLDLCAQHAGGRPADVELKRDIYPAADGVQLVEDQTRWWDVKGYSGRLQQKQVLGGLVGTAVYQAEDWRPLLPWLLWGVSTHVGKNIVKGCGWYRVSG